MKILILADSKAMWPREYNWPMVLQKLIGPEHQVTAYVSGVDKWLISIYMMEEYLLANFAGEVFDLIIAQVGWHEGGPCYWTKEVWEEIVNTKHRKFNPAMLCEEVEVDGKKKYLYIDREEEKSVFDTFKKYSKNFLFAGIHSFRPNPVHVAPFTQTLIHQYRSLEGNYAFSSSSNSFNFPMDETWINLSCLPDRVHYNYNGVNFVSSYIHKFILRMNHTIPSLFFGADKYNGLYNSSEVIGSSIARLTQKGDVVLISGKTSSDLMAKFLGCILYGRKPLIIQRPSSKVSSEEFSAKMEELTEKVRPSLCLCDSDDSFIFSNFFHTFSDLPVGNPIEHPYVPSPDDVAFLQLSSGTTGRVKIFSVTHRQAIENIAEYGSSIGINDDSVVCSWLPLYHDMGLITSFLMPILFNISSSIIDPFDWLVSPKDWLMDVQKRGGTHIWMPNFAFSYLSKIDDAELSGLSLSSVKHIISCSEPTYVKYLKEFNKKYSKYGLNSSLSNCYALAENVFAVSQSTNLRTTLFEGQEFASCGRSIMGVSILIAGENDEDLPERTKGRVVIKSNTLVAKELNKYGYYDTGDIGFMEMGELFIMGRSKDSFVSYGNNVYPHLIELSVDQSLFIPGRIACFPIFDELKGTNRVGVAVESTLENVDEIKSKISSSIKGLFEVASEIFVEKPRFLIKTSSGKIIRSKTAQKIQTRKKILDLLNGFLSSHNRQAVKSNEPIWSSGLMDSLDMMHLVMTLEKNGLALKKDELTKDSYKIDLSRLDSVDKIVELT